MPLVKSQSTAFRDVDGKRFIMRINCSPDGTFTIKLPAQVTEVLGRKLAKGKQMDEAIREFNRALGEFEAANQTHERVIVYQVQSVHSIVNSDGIVLAATDDISFCTGTALSVAAGVYDKITTTKGDGSKTYRYNLMESTIPDGLQRLGKKLTGQQDFEMPWSREREDLFRRIGLGLEALITQLTEACSDSKQLAKLADSMQSPFKLLTNA